MNSENNYAKLRIFTVTTIMIIVIALSIASYILNDPFMSAFAMFAPAIVAFIYKLIFKIKYKDNKNSFIGTIKASIGGIVVLWGIIMLTWFIAHVMKANPKSFSIPSLTLIASAVLNIIATFGEEYGWRGTIFRSYMDENNLTQGTIRTSLIWGMFHVPVVIVLSIPLLKISVLMFISVIVVQFLATVFAGLWFNYLYKISGFGAILVVSLLHSLWNSYNEYLNLSVYQAGMFRSWNNIIYDGEGLVGVLLFAIITIIFSKKILFIDSKSNASNTENTENSENDEFSQKIEENHNNLKSNKS